MEKLRRDRLLSVVSGKFSIVRVVSYLFYPTSARQWRLVTSSEAFCQANGTIS
jgi:hypothetical protein